MEKTEDNLFNKYASIAVTPPPKVTSGTKSHLEQEQEREPTNVQIEREKFTFFWNSSSPFSQHYLPTFRINGITYTSAKQYMMQQKALLSGDSRTAELIMQSNCPK